MERRVRLPEGELAYIWTRKRVKNWNLRVSPDGTVTLSTPTGVTGAEADRYVIGKAAWIDASRRRLAGRKPLCLTDGARFAVAGVPVRLHIETGEAGPARWEDGSLTLRLPAGLSQDEEKEAVREALRQVLRDPAERMLTELLRRSLLWMEAETGRTDGPFPDSAMDALEMGELRARAEPADAERRSCPGPAGLRGVCGDP